MTAQPHREETFTDGTTMVVLSEKPGDRIGHYKLLEKLGEGGMGVVYMAEQEQPVWRKVALKIIKLGMETKSVIARFETERQALALMDHPNIARVFDAGATETGRPFFVMELVRGVPITEYCDKNHLSARQRLELFLPICQAIQHAHQKGIIHRDLKPSNVLVTLLDGRPVPTVIDFGIAKATHQKLTEKTLFTNLGQMIGTPAYMSPEQAEMNKLDVDTRSDIYSLGVLLYELLTGTTPFPEKRLRSAGFGEMQRIIAEEEPERPSTRLSTMANQQRTTLARNHNMEVSALGRLLRGDLDWIAMKCLEKDRARRYETVNGLANDILRHLMNEPVTAVAPSIRYRLGKFVRRNKTKLSVAAALVFLTGALSVSMVLLLNEWRAAKFGGIRINSNPEGAEVWRDGRFVGRTPLMIPKIPAGEFTYSLALVNYERITNTTTMAPKRQVNDFTFLRKAEVVWTNALPTTGSSPLQEIAAAAPGGGTVVTFVGEVRVLRKGASQWIPAQTNMPLFVGDRVRTSGKSRATLRLSDLRVLRVDQLTSIELHSSVQGQMKPTLNLKNGSLDFYDHGGTGTSIVTPWAKAKIKG